jgi:very-short-patch-repair endonuclease
MRSLDEAIRGLVPTLPAETAADRARLNLEHIADRPARDETGFRSVFRRCESPIEQQFCLALFQVAGVRGRVQFAASMLNGPRDRLLVFAQHTLDRYRVDFLIVAPAASAAEPIFLVVECDGGHHNEALQRAQDLRRQRAIEKIGFKLLRFTGREIFDDPRAVIGCTLEACGWDPGLVRFRNLDMWRAFQALRGWKSPALAEVEWTE